MPMTSTGRGNGGRSFRPLTASVLVGVPFLPMEILEVAFRIIDLSYERIGRWCSDGVRDLAGCRACTQVLRGILCDSGASLTPFRKPETAGSSLYSILPAPVTAQALSG